MRLAVSALLTASLMLSLSADVGAQGGGPDLSLVKFHAEGPVNFKSIPGGPVGVYFTVQNTGAIAGNVRAHIYFCRTQALDTCYKSPLHVENVGELLSPGRNRRSAAALKIDVKVPLDAEPGERWARIWVNSTSGETNMTNNDAFVSFQVVPPKCVKWVKSGRKKVCQQWTNPG
jgi:hypothetical protein